MRRPAIVCVHHKRSTHQPQASQRGTEEDRFAQFPSMIVVSLAFGPTTATPFRNLASDSGRIAAGLWSRIIPCTAAWYARSVCSALAATECGIRRYGLTDSLTSNSPTLNRAMRIRPVGSKSASERQTRVARVARWLGQSVAALTHRRVDRGSVDQAGREARAQSLVVDASQVHVRARRDRCDDGLADRPAVRAGAGITAARSPQVSAQTARNRTGRETDQSDR